MRCECVIGFAPDLNHHSRLHNRANLCVIKIAVACAWPVAVYFLWAVMLQKFRCGIEWKEGYHFEWVFSVTLRTSDRTCLLLSQVWLWISITVEDRRYQDTVCITGRPKGCDIRAPDHTRPTSVARPCDLLPPYLNLLAEKAFLPFPQHLMALSHLINLYL